MFSNDWFIKLFLEGEFGFRGRDMGLFVYISEKIFWKFVYVRVFISIIIVNFWSNGFYMMIIYNYYIYVSGRSLGDNK